MQSSVYIVELVIYAYLNNFNRFFVFLPFLIPEDKPLIVEIQGNNQGLGPKIIFVAPLYQKPSELDDKNNINYNLLLNNKLQFAF